MRDAARAVLRCRPLVHAIVLAALAAGAAAPVAAQTATGWPFADFTWSPASPRPGELVAFQDRSNDEDGFIVAWQWDFGDGATSTARNPTHPYEKSGTYFVTLTVRDDDQRSTKTERTLRVASSGPATDAAAPGSGKIQAMIDAASPGDIVRLPDGYHEENVVVTKELTLQGGAATTINGLSEPALEIAFARVTVRDVKLASDWMAIAMHDAPGVTLVNVRFEDPFPGGAENVDLVHVIVAPDEEPPALMLRNSVMLHSHPLDLRLVDDHDRPLAGVEVVVEDDGITIVKTRSDSDGVVALDAVPHAVESNGVVEQRTVVAHIEGRARPVILDPHATMQRVVVGDAAGFREGPSMPALPGLPSVEAAPVVATAAGAAGAAAAAGLAFRYSEPFRWRWLGFFAPLYTRLAKSEILEHGTREAIYGYVEDNPGAHLRAIKRDLSLHHGTLLHHLGMLERQGYLRSVRDGMYRRYYVAGAALPMEAADPLSSLVERHIMEHPGATNAELAEALGKRPSLVHYHVERLAEQGRVRKEREGRSVRLFGNSGGQRGTVGDSWGPTETT